MKSILVKGFARAQAILLDAISDQGTGCTITPMGFDEFGLEVNDDKAHRLTTARDRAPEKPVTLVAVYMDGTRIATGVFNNFRSIQTFFLRQARALSNKKHKSFDDLVEQARMSGTPRLLVFKSEYMNDLCLRSNWPLAED